MKTLYKIIDGKSRDFYIIAEGPTEAVEMLTEKYEVWQYTRSPVISIQVIASEGCYGEPLPLII